MTEITIAPDNTVILTDKYINTKLQLIIDLIKHEKWGDNCLCDTLVSVWHHNESSITGKHPCFVITYLPMELLKEDEIDNNLYDGFALWVRSKINLLDFQCGIYCWPEGEREPRIKFLESLKK